MHEAAHKQHDRCQGLEPVPRRCKTAFAWLPSQILLSGKQLSYYNTTVLVNSGSAIASFPQGSHNSVGKALHADQPRIMKAVLKQQQEDCAKAVAVSALQPSVNVSVAP